MSFACSICAKIYSILLLVSMCSGIYWGIHFFSSLIFIIRERHCVCQWNQTPSSFHFLCSLASSLSPFSPPTLADAHWSWTCCHYKKGTQFWSILTRPNHPCAKESMIYIEIIALWLFTENACGLQPHLQSRSSMKIPFVHSTLQPQHEEAINKRSQIIFHVTFGLRMELGSKSHLQKPTSLESPITVVFVPTYMYLLLVVVFISP